MNDITPLHGLAMVLLLSCWFAYPIILKLFGIGPLNSQLVTARRQWIHEMAHRPGKPFDAVLLGHIVHSVAFFGSATLIVLAGIFSVVVKLDGIHKTLTGIDFIQPVSLELFILEYALLTGVFTLCFFSFTYALRKLLYSIALIGALPESPNEVVDFDDLVDDTTTVITEALKTFNFGIRGYYYAIASICLFISPMFCITATLIATSVLVFRQVRTPTSRAIARYIEKTEQRLK